VTGPEDLFHAALAAREKAYAPFSGFAVGCALRTASGKVFAGANVENQAYPEGWCAETSAIAAMVMGGTGAEDRVIAEVLVAADSPAPVTPCGGCRQRLAEFGRPDTVIHAAGPEGLRESWTLGELLPAAFRLQPGGAA
jgi:cytidine deaminase